MTLALCDLGRRALAQIGSATPLSALRPLAWRAANAFRDRDDAGGVAARLAHLDEFDEPRALAEFCAKQIGACRDDRDEDGLLALDGGRHGQTGVGRYEPALAAIESTASCRNPGVCPVDGAR